MPVRPIITTPRSHLAQLPKVNLTNLPEWLEQSCGAVGAKLDRTLAAFGLKNAEDVTRFMNSDAGQTVIHEIARELDIKAKQAEDERLRLDFEARVKRYLIGLFLMYKASKARAQQEKNNQIAEQQDANLQDMRSKAQKQQGAAQKQTLHALVEAYNERLNQLFIQKDAIDFRLGVLADRTEALSQKLDETLVDLHSIELIERHFEHSLDILDGHELHDLPAFETDNEAEHGIRRIQEDIAALRKEDGWADKIHAYTKHKQTTIAEESLSKEQPTMLALKTQSTLLQVMRRYAEHHLTLQSQTVMHHGVHYRLPAGKSFDALEAEGQEAMAKAAEDYNNWAKTSSKEVRQNCLDDLHSHKTACLHQCQSIESELHAIQGEIEILQHDKARLEERITKQQAAIAELKPALENRASATPPSPSPASTLLKQGLFAAPSPHKVEVMQTKAQLMRILAARTANPEETTNLQERLARMAPSNPDLHQRLVNQITGSLNQKDAKNTLGSTLTLFNQLARTYQIALHPEAKAQASTSPSPLKTTPG